MSAIGETAARGRQLRCAGTTVPSRIAVFGSANMDLVVRVNTPPLPGETVFGESFATVVGGKGLNQAVAASRAGGEVQFVGCVGQDAFGSDIFDLLREEGIDAESVRQVQATTGTAHITVDASGQNSIIVVAGANLATTADQLASQRWDGLGWLVTQLEVELDQVGRALQAARDHGVRTVLTPAPARALDPALLANVDLLIPNQFEAASLSGITDPLAAAVALSRLCGDVIVTLGADGSAWASQGEIVARVPARPVTVVDTTAAGDTFVGVLVALLAEGRNVLDALELATTASGIVVGRPGATSSMPRRAEFWSPARAAVSPPG